MTASKAARPRITIIVAYAKNRVIGRGGNIPWRLVGDLKRFRQLTMGHNIIMGRKTWESIGRLLPGRKHIIVSRKPGYEVAGAKVVDSVEAAVAAARDDSEIFVIGGGEIYARALPLADRILATEIEAKFDGDTYFPELEKGNWRETARQSGEDSERGLRYFFVTLERRA